MVFPSNAFDIKGNIYAPFSLPCSAVIFRSHYPNDDSAPSVPYFYTYGMCSTL